MINLQETLVIIPARKGSKGISGKNKKILGGKPLIQYTIDISITLFPKEIICVSTDDEDIQLLAEKSGLKVPYLREEKYSGDKTSGREVILYELSVCVLYAMESISGFIAAKNVSGRQPGTSTSDSRKKI